MGREKSWQKLVILKADDLGFQPGVASFRRLMAISSRRRIPLSIGVITSRLNGLPRHDISYLRSSFEDPTFELWNHSHSHRNLTTLSRQEQGDEIEKAQALIQETLGVACRVFGAPYNKYNEETLHALETCPGLEAVYLLEPPLAAGTKLVNAPRAALLSPEYVRPFTRQNDLAEFIRRFQLLKNAELKVVQFHPPAWNDHGFEQYECCLDYLLEQGVRFLTMAEYVAFQQQGGDAERRDLTALPIRVAAIAADITLQGSAHHLEERFAAEKRLSSFFYNRHLLGTQHVLRAFERIGFDLPPPVNPGKIHACLDIGCGSGNWLVGYGLLHPRADLFGLDGLAPCAEIAREQLGAAGMAGRATIIGGSVEKVPPLPRCITRAWCINAGQYMEKESLFAFVNKTLTHQGEFLLSIQTIDYFLGAALQSFSLPEANLADGVSRLETILSSFARRAGVRSPSGVYVYDHDEIVFCAKDYGLDLIVEGVTFEEPVAGYRRHPYLKSYLMSNRLLPPGKEENDLFPALSGAEQSNYLKELRSFGLWRRLHALNEKYYATMPEELGDDLRALLPFMTSLPSSHPPAVDSERLSLPVRALLAINNGDHNAPILHAEADGDPEMSFLKGLSSYRQGDMPATLRACNQRPGFFDGRLAVLAAAAAAKAGMNVEAVAAIDLYYGQRPDAGSGDGPRHRG